jgi:hypothetical protein
MALSCPSKSNASQSRPRYEVADIFRRYGKEYQATHSLTRRQRAVMFDIAHCRTSTFGYHVDRCEQCGYTEGAYNSCRNRHCPTCQGISQRRWVKARLEDLLPVPYYHVVFTLPHSLFPLSLYNKELVYELLLDSASETLLYFGRDPRWLGGEIGFYGVLHTWGQTLWHHIHSHFIVPGGGLTKDGQWVEPRYRGAFLFPIHALSEVFRGKFIEALKKAYDHSDMVVPEELNHLAHAHEFEAWVDELVSQDWVVYCKPPVGGPEQVVRYLGSYTHRVAISNHRLISIDHGQIRFRYKDYKDKRLIWKDMSLPVNDFIQRFLWHVLPGGFHKIRHYGFLANGKAKAKVAQIRGLLRAKISTRSEESSKHTIGVPCPVCKRGKLIPSLIIDRFGTMVFKALSSFRAGYSFNTS